MEPAIADRIMASFNSAICSAENMGDFDIIPSVGDKNVSPVTVLQGNIGIASWCLDHVYSYAFKCALRSKDSLWRFEDCEKVHLWTQFCLAVCPEVATMWNLRRILLKRGVVNHACEMRLTRLILSRKPKCLEAFQQRRWILEREIPVSEDDGMVSQELALCTWAAERHQNNYHAWNHRLWVLKTALKRGRCDAVLKSELSQGRDWVDTHVSEHSGMHYVAQVADIITDRAKQGSFPLNQLASSPMCLYEELLEWNKELITHYPGHEALYYSRRALLMRWRQYSCTAEAERKEGSQKTWEWHDSDNLHVITENNSVQLINKKSCIENLMSAWAKVAARELRLAEQWRDSADSEHCKELACRHSKAIARISL